MAAHLHDSVLQTLALMQKRADDPREVAALARRQERELRAWLAGAPRRRATARGWPPRSRTPPPRSRTTHGVPVEVVAVGDCRSTSAGEALVAAAREAMVNAAKFGGGATGRRLRRGRRRRALQVFVRDRGPGFDPAAVPGRPARRARVDRRPDGAPRRPRARSRGARRGGTEVELRARAGAA